MAVLYYMVRIIVTIMIREAGACTWCECVVSAVVGCVITYDILAGWNPAEQYDQYVSSIIVSTVE